MSSDRRWTGGLANREWQRGSQPPVPLLDPRYVAAQIEAYRSDCYAARAYLDRANHPTAAGAVKVIYHRGTAQRMQIVRAFEQATQ